MRLAILYIATIVLGSLIGMGLDASFDRIEALEAHIEGMDK